MSIKNEIMRLKSECENKITEKQMELSFGEDFDARFIKDKYHRNRWNFLFQEDEHFYIAPVEWFRGCYRFTGLVREVTDDDLEEFIRLDKVHKREIKLFNEVFDHPKFRLKTLFKQ